LWKNKLICSSRIFTTFEDLLIVTGDGGKSPGMGGVLEATLNGGVCLIPKATKFGAEFFGAKSLTPVSGKLLPVPVLSSPEFIDGTLIG
jgi:hypothetical protein